MKAVRFAGNGVVEVIEKDMPKPGTQDVLIKVSYCGLCGSENRVVRSGSLHCVPGHEIAGTVVCCGSQAKQFPQDCPVLVYLSNYCGQCEACRSGNTSQCTERNGLIGWGFDGGYEEYVTVPGHMVFPLEDIPTHLGVLALDTIGTAFHGLRQAQIEEGSTALVIGCGPIGLGCVSILKNHYHIETIYAADISRYHLDIAKNIGATPVLVDPLNTIESIEKALGGMRFRHVIEVCGMNDTIAASVHFVHAGGRAVMIGEPEKALILKRTSEWILKDFSLINSWYFPIRELGENLKFIKDNRTQVEKLITHYFTLNEMTQAYALFQSGHTGKVLVRIGGQ